MNIAFFDTKSYDKESFDSALKDFGKDARHTIKYFDTKLCLDTAELARGYDSVCVFVNDTIDAPMIDRLCRMGVKLVALRCAGFNNVDLRAAHDKLTVVRVPAYSPYAVAEHTMAMLLTSIRRIHKAYIRTKDHNFSLSGLTGFDLHGKTVGVIGSGKIGRAFISICLGFGMRVLAFDKYPDYSLEECGSVSYVSLDTLLRESDIISLHCPLSDETYHLIDGSALSKCRRGVVILNTSRGALVDAEALLSAIRSRQVGAACLDVYEEEADLFFEDRSGHILEDDTLARLISMPNVIVTSHQAFLTREALSSIAHTTLKNISQIEDGTACENEVRFCARLHQKH